MDRRVVGTAIDIGAVEAVAPPIGESYTTAEDTPLVVTPPGVLANDPDGAHSTALLATPPSHGTVNLAADGSFSYTPNATYNGPDSFGYVAQGPIGPTGTATVDIAAAAPTTTATPPTTAPGAVPTPTEPTPATEPTTPGGELPATGSDPRSSAELAAGILGAGIALSTLATRRRCRLRRG